MSAGVTYSGDEFTIKITDETTGKSYSTSSRVSGAKRSSAEWIAEAPCCTNRGGILPLSDFGTVYFGPGSATDASNSGVIDTFGNSVQEITMVSSSGATEAIPSTVAGGGQFAVTWESE